MSENNSNEISLVDLFAVLWAKRLMIILITGLAMVFAVVYAIVSLKLPPEKSYMPNKYTPQAQMLISNGDSGISMPAGLGGLASLAGVSIPSNASNSSLAEYLVRSNITLDAVNKQFNFTERYKIEKSAVANTREALREVLKSNFDSDSGIFTVSFTDIDPVFARDVVNYVVSILEKRFEEIGVDKNRLQKKNLEENIQTCYETMMSLEKQLKEVETSTSNYYDSRNVPSIMMDITMIKTELEVQQQIYAQLKQQYELLKVTMASEQPVFQILEYAEVPDLKSGPSRGKLCIIITFAAGFFSVFLAFLLNALKNIKSDPEVVAKFKKQ